MQKIKLGANMIYFGEKALMALSDLKGSMNKALIVESGTILQTLGIESELTELLSAADIDYQIFNNVGPEPAYKDIEKGVVLANAFQPDWIIGLGGGSAMDAAKIIWAIYENPELTSIDELAKPNNIKSLRKKARLCCITTTAGTGSEVTRAAVFTDEESKRKIAIADSINLRLVPDIAILDPQLTMTMPPSLTASTGMDALTHAVEAFLSKRSNVFSDGMAVAAYKLINKNLLNSYNQPKVYEYKANMLAASTMAGIAFSNGGLGICHSLAHVLGAKLKVAHGMANAILLPYVIELLKGYPACCLRISQLESETGTADLTVSIRNLNASLHIPDSFKTLNSTNYDWFMQMEELIDLTLADPNTKNSPVEPTRAELKMIITSAFK
ncbi:Aldehyde-alcohol dehydrogenase [bioreactor metagenome]|uniref:Aldehyde-alcohol dehydrogenase n=1 Tax=bioreactor metagenome TaxID=1076179 RepID=A0A645AP28_9ZZZZ